MPETKQAKKDEIQEEAVPLEKLDGSHDEGTQQRSEELDLKKYGDMPVSVGGGKPTFEKVTKMVVTKCSLMMGDEKTQAKKDGTPDKFRPVHLNVEYSYDDGKKAFENYGGGKMYLSDSDSSKNKFWVGEGSALGKLISKLNDTFDFKGRISEIPGFVQGKVVGVKTEVMTVGNNEYQKNIIQVFYI